MADHESRNGKTLSRRQFLSGTAAALVSGGNASNLLARQQSQATAGTDADLAFVNGRIHTMDAQNSVVSQALIRNGRFAAVGNNVNVPRGTRRVNLMGKTVIPGLIDAHNHIVSFRQSRLEFNEAGDRQKNCQRKSFAGSADYSSGLDQACAGSKERRRC